MSSCNNEVFPFCQPVSETPDVCFRDAQGCVHHGKKVVNIDCETRKVTSVVYVTDAGVTIANAVEVSCPKMVMVANPCALGGGGNSEQGGGNTPTPTEGPTASVTRVEVTNAGATVIGARSVAVTNVGNANGTLAGAPLYPGESVSVSSHFDPVANVNHLIGALAYDATGTVFHITVQR